MESNKLENILNSLKDLSLKDWEEIKESLDMYFEYQKNEYAAKIKIDDTNDLKKYFRHHR